MKNLLKNLLTLVGSPSPPPQVLALPGPVPRRAEHLLVPPFLLRTGREGNLFRPRVDHPDLPEYDVASRLYHVHVCGGRDAPSFRYK